MTLPLCTGHVPHIGAGQAIEEPGRGLAGQGGVGAVEVLMKTFWAGIHSDFQIWGLLSSPWGDVIYQMDQQRYYHP